jgi:hypothetical protein
VPESSSISIVAPPGGGRGDRGASLVEAVIAAALVTTIAAGVAHLLVWSRHEAWSAGMRSTAVFLAVQKMEQLRSLAWYADPAGAGISDETTNLAEDPPAAGGSGLQPSPGGSLVQNTAGFVDYVDLQGRWCATGARPPACAAFVRRWAVQPFDADPADTRVLTVLVVPAGEASRRASPRAVRLQTIRTRAAR